MASQREVLLKLQRKAQLMNVNSTDERESGTTTLMIDGNWRFRGRKWKDFFWERSRESQEMEPVSKEK